MHFDSQKMGKLQDRRRCTLHKAGEKRDERSVGAQDALAERIARKTARFQKLHLVVCPAALGPYGEEKPSFPMHGRT